MKTKLKGHQKRITGLAFSNVLNVLVSSGADSQVKLSYMQVLLSWLKMALFIYLFFKVLTRMIISFVVYLCSH